MIGSRSWNTKRAQRLLAGGSEGVGESLAIAEFGERLPWLRRLVAVLALAAFGYHFGAVCLAFAVTVVVLVFRVYCSRRRFTRIESFESDYPTLLIALASSVRAGLDPLVAMTSAATLFPGDSLLRSELELFAGAIAAGATEEKAIREFGRSVEHPDLILLRNAYLIARREGASLGESLHRLARVTRQRQSFRRKIRAAIAMQRLSAIGIAGCAVIIGVFQVSTNPQGIAGALTDPRGVMALAVGASLIVGGLIWMMYLVRSRV